MFSHKGHNNTDTYSKSILIIPKNLWKINNKFERNKHKNTVLIQNKKQSCKYFTIFSFLICRNFHSVVHSAQFSYVNFVITVFCPITKLLFILIWNYSTSSSVDNTIAEFRNTLY